MPDERNEQSISEDAKLADEEGAVANGPRSHQRMASGRNWDFTFRGKLYNRAKETDELLEVYRRVATRSTKTELVLVSGGSGVGKVSHFQSFEGFIDSMNSAVSSRITSNPVAYVHVCVCLYLLFQTALAQSIRKMVMEKDGYFAMGKFDQLQCPEPHTAIISAIAEFATHVMEKGEARVGQIRERVNERVASEGKLLTDMIPELRKILTDQEHLNFVGHSSEAVNRFKYVFRMFLRGAASPEHPLVLFLDDMHWADEASLDLLESLFSDSENDGIMFLGTYRDDGDASSKRLKAMLSNLDKSKVTMTDIELGPFEEEAVNAMLAELLMFDRDKTKPLSIVIYNQTKGNICFIWEYLRSLNDTGMIQFDKKADQWNWDPQEIRVDFGSNITDRIRAKLALLPAKAQETLKLASCLGSRIDEDVLKHLMGEPIFSYLQLAESKGLIDIDLIRGGYTFSHDGIQEATYHLIPEKERVAYHLEIGKKMWKSFDVNELDDVVFAIVGQLMVGSSLITDKKEKYAVAALCLRAGERAVQLSSFQTAYLYLLHGLSLLGARCWQEDYLVSLSLYSAASEVAYCTSDFGSVSMFVKEIFAHAKCFEDTLRGHATKVHSLGKSGKVNEAVATGLEILEKLGETFPKNSTMLDVDVALKRLNKRLKGRSDESLLKLPNMTEPNKLAAMQMMNITFLYAFMGDKKLAFFFGIRMVSLSLDHGLSTFSCVGFVVLGMILCG
jgi:predicted ATPase